MKPVLIIAAALAGGCAVLDDDGDESDASLATADLATTPCPGIDTSSGVPTYRGLAGAYVRYSLPATGEPLRLSLVTTVDDPDAAGTFTGLRTTASGLPSTYHGTFRALADNPAIGPVLALDTTGDGVLDESYFVLGLARRITGAVSRLCLAGGAAPFVMIRSAF